MELTQVVYPSVSAGTSKGGGGDTFLALLLIAGLGFLFYQFFIKGLDKPTVKPVAVVEPTDGTEIEPTNSTEIKPKEPPKNGAK